MRIFNFPPCERPGQPRLSLGHPRGRPAVTPGPLPGATTGRRTAAPGGALAQKQPALFHPLRLQIQRQGCSCECQRRQRNAVRAGNPWAARVPIRKHLFLPARAGCERAHGNVMGLKYITGLRQCCTDQLPWMLEIGRGEKKKKEKQISLFGMDITFMFYVLFVPFARCRAGARPSLCTVQFISKETGAEFRQF